MGRIGVTELLLIGLIAVLLFGAGKLADIGKGLGDGIRNFKKGLRDDPEPAVPNELNAKPSAPAQSEETKKA